MKKIPCLLQREFYDDHTFKLLEDKITPGCEWVLDRSIGVATEKFDGTACLIKNGELYKRYDAKKGKQPPKDAIPCQEPDPITGHWPHWVKIDRNKKEDKWYVEAWDRLNNTADLFNRYIQDGTYELCGPHFQGNPYNYIYDEFRKHSDYILNDVPRTIDGIKKYLEEHYIEGIVFHKCDIDDTMCKIRRKDFGFKWNEK